MKEALEQIHIIIHSLRLIPNYKSSLAEQKIGKIIRDNFKETCKECREIAESNKNAPPEKTGILNRIGKIISEGEA